MWLLEINPQKARRYAAEIYLQNSFSFDDNTGYKKNCRPQNLRNTRAFRYLKKDKFDQYLSADPNELQILHQELFDYILNRPDMVFNQKHFAEYRQDVIKGKSHKRHSEYSAITDDEIDAIKHIFNYDKYISCNSSFSYFLAELLDCNTCTYCNRQYTLTIVDDNDDRIIRPQFDHWFAQSLYPDLALSYYNLIPSCSFCNSNLKIATNTEIDTHIHPYLDNDRGFKFTYLLNQNDGYDVDIEITSTDPTHRRRVENTLSLFRIQEVYRAHSGLELKDMLELASAYPDEYIESLINKVMNSTNLDRETVLRLLFGIENDPHKFHYRPLSKFKSDILEKLQKK